jgi:2-polyprenyl-3-methyl-5-hydroxy-6-metoxy-1,4-benzoquinol methylase
VVVSEPNEQRVQGRFAYVRCRRCDLVYANPRLVESARNAAYAACASPGFSTERGQAGAFTRWWRYTTQRQVVGDWVKEGPVLDVGCHTGDLLLSLRERGLEVSGIESSNDGVRVCRERGLAVTQGLVEDVPLPPDHFRTILMSHVLEHVGDPLAILRKLNAALVPGGRIVVAVPNCRGAVARVFGPYWHGWDPPYHLIQYDPRTLRCILSAGGFVVTQMQTRGLPEDVTRSLSKLLRRPVRSLWARLALLPGSMALGRLSLGGEVCAVAERPAS